MSPRRYAGWEPTVQHIYDEGGRLTGTRSEPEWDEWDNALIDALENWNAGVHSCGHHESEQDSPGAVFVAGYTACKACEALQAAQETQRAADAPAIKNGKNPDFPRRWRVRLTTAAEYLAEAKAKAEARAHRKSPEELMAEVLAKVAATGPRPS